jgi:hypothetical protein
MHTTLTMIFNLISKYKIMAKLDANELGDHNSYHKSMNFEK